MSKDKSKKIRLMTVYLNDEMPFKIKTIGKYRNLCDKIKKSIFNMKLFLYRIDDDDLLYSIQPTILFYCFVKEDPIKLYKHAKIFPFDCPDFVRSIINDSELLQLLKYLIEPKTTDEVINNKQFPNVTIHTLNKLVKIDLVSIEKILQSKPNVYVNAYHFHWRAFGLSWF